MEFFIVGGPSYIVDYAKKSKSPKKSKRIANINVIFVVIFKVS